MKKVCKIVIPCEIILIVCGLLSGIFHRNNTTTISMGFVSMATKSFYTNYWQNLLWLLSNNFAVLFLAYFANYWTAGILGTLWTVRTAFIFGVLYKLYIYFPNKFLSLFFVTLELISASAVAIASTYHTIEKQKPIYIWYTVPILVLIAAAIEAYVLGTL